MCSYELVFRRVSQKSTKSQRQLNPLNNTRRRTEHTKRRVSRRQAALCIVHFWRTRKPYWIGAAAGVSSLFGPLPALKEVFRLGVMPGRPADRRPSSPEPELTASRGWLGGGFKSSSSSSFRAAESASIRSFRFWILSEEVPPLFCDGLRSC